MGEIRRFVLLDRDGTINVERHYLSNPDEMALYPGVGRALARLRALGLGLAVVTNQSGIARGYFDNDMLARIHDRMTELLGAETVVLDGIYVCPHGPDEDCACRKPRPGLALAAARDLGFDPAKAFVVGDKLADIALAGAIGAPGILVRTGHGREEEAKAAPLARAVVDDLPAAAAWIEAALAAEREQGR